MGRTKNMVESKAKTIKIIGIVLIIISTLEILSTISGLFMFDYLIEVEYNIEKSHFYDQTVEFVKPIAIISIGFALSFLVIGVFLIRYRNWARVLLQVVATLYLVSVWCQSIFIAPHNFFDNGKLGIDHIIGALIWSVPIILLIRYLKQEKVKNHFI
ncbi:hypothetical protein [Adhaeribacter terreus]|uniref:DUF2569 domain-containing protein n=1 Tax=Adhaeribacter terreus TaxID=529703 RepID=A0ABW0E7V2_9BACT